MIRGSLQQEENLGATLTVASNIGGSMKVIGALDTDLSVAPFQKIYVGDLGCSIVVKNANGETEICDDFILEIMGD
jgi:hypothetical protein